MLRAGYKLCGPKGIFLKPYACSFELSCHNASTNPAANVQNLPRLPVPKLSETLSKYLKTVRPHLNDEEFSQTVKLAKNFENGEGRKLQSLLESRAEKHLNWLEDWWLNTAYLEYRDPVVVFSSPGLVFPFRKFNNQSEQLQYAAQTLLALLEYKSLIDRNEIPTEMMGKNPLDMSQYRKIFGTCRIPDEKRDKLSYNDSKYVTVIHNNHIFHVDLWGEDDVILGEEQIVNQLKKVIELSQSRTDCSVGILTSENRDNWAKAFNLMSKDNLNRESLADIEKSLVVLCLDAPVDLWKYQDKNAQQNLAAAQTIHGGGSDSNGCNRWFDKTVQFIVGADGVTGLTYEHSPAEGQPIAVLTDYIIKYIDQGKKPLTQSNKPKDPVLLKFNLNNEISEMITTAKTSLNRLADNLELNCFTYEKYGKNFIKTQKMSPDSYLQMAMQYAFYRLHKTPGAHYESAATRMYVGGRTETIRSCSIESIDFAKTMLNAQRSPKEKVQAMKDAINAHKNYTVQIEDDSTESLLWHRKTFVKGVKCRMKGNVARAEARWFPRLAFNETYSSNILVQSFRVPYPKVVDQREPLELDLMYGRQHVKALQGFGVDRHLLGLKLIALENGLEVPKLYTDPGYIKSAHMRISTSQVACKCDGFMCYGPLVPNGYATCYNPRDNDVNFATSSFASNTETDCAKYRKALEQSLQDMHDLLLKTTQSKL